MLAGEFIISDICTFWIYNIFLTGLLILYFFLALLFGSMTQALLLLAILYLSSLLLISTQIIGPFLLWIVDAIREG